LCNNRPEVGIFNRTQTWTVHPGLRRKTLQAHADFRRRPLVIVRSRIYVCMHVRVRSENGNADFAFISNTRPRRTNYGRFILCDERPILRATSFKFDRSPVGRTRRRTRRQRILPVYTNRLCVLDSQRNRHVPSTTTTTTTTTTDGNIRNIRPVERKR